MPDLILHKDGAYNLYTTVADGACFEGALTLGQLTEYIKSELGDFGIRALPGRLARAHKTGCSSINALTLDECIASNRAGPGEIHLSNTEFIAQYLTLPKEILCL